MGEGIQRKFNATGPAELWTGTACGCVKPKSEFTRDNPARCKACLKERAKTLKEGKKSDPNQRVGSCPTPDEAKAIQPPDSLICDTHGPHHGSKMGGRPSLDCPKCAEEKRIAALRKTMEQRISVDLGGGLSWLRLFLSEEAERRDKTPMDVIVDALIVMVPDQDMKRLMIQSRG